MATTVSKNPWHSNDTKGPHTVKLSLYCHRKCNISVLKDPLESMHRWGL